jgi:hypothetical protein
MSRPALGVFLILWASYAFFWHARDWNTASRLMLTYAIVDHGTIRIDGLDDQTGDKARYRNHYYSDKLPGFSVVATIPYLVAKRVARWPDHPVDLPGFAHWPGDYVTTLFTSGLISALTGALLVGLARDLGCGPRRSILIGLAYGLATPAYAYATLAYGHQAAAACLLGAFTLLWRTPTRRVEWSAGLAGFLAAYASVIEIQVGPVSAILGCYAIVQVVGRQRPVASLFAFGVGAILPTLLLLGYNWVAFDSPFRMGYFYHATQRFANVHSAANPLGIGRPDWGRLGDLLIQPARGILWYAPIAALAVPGWVVLLFRRYFAVAIVSVAVVAAVLLVNLSYPEWSGGWSTGPRLLVPMLPFVMLPVAGLLAIGGRAGSWIAATLAVGGGLIILLFQGVGARVPDPQPTPPGVVNALAHPLTDAVWPIWRGDRPPGWLFGHRFARNLVSMAWPHWVAERPEGRQWMQFLPLVAFQALAIGALFWWCRSMPVRPSSDRAIESPRADTPEPARPDPA